MRLHLNCVCRLINIQFVVLPFSATLMSPTTIIRTTNLAVTFGGRFALVIRTLANGAVIQVASLPILLARQPYRHGGPKPALRYQWKSEPAGAMDLRH